MSSARASWTAGGEAAGPSARATRCLGLPGLLAVLLAVLVPLAARAAGDGLTGTYYNQNNQAGAYFTGTAVTRVDPTVNFNWGYGSPAPPTIGTDNFSVRWTGQVETQAAGNYVFRTNSDDGVRLWINGTLVIDDWTDHAATVDTSASIPLAANTRYDVRLEYYEHTGVAVMQLSWSGPGIPLEIIPQAQLYSSAPPVLESAHNPCQRLDQVIVSFSEAVDPTSAQTAANYALSNGVSVQSASLQADGSTVVLTTATPLTDGSAYTLTVNNVTDLATPPNPIAPNSQITFTASQGVLMPGVVGEYFNQNGQQGQYFTGTTVTRIDSTIDFNWGRGSPARPTIGRDNFSVRWTGILIPPATGDYTFTTNSDDGVRLYVNGQLVIDDWTDHPATMDTSPVIALTAGTEVDITMEYYEHFGYAVAQLLWSGPGIPQEVVPASQLFHCEHPPAPVAYYALDETSWAGVPGEVVDGSGNGHNGTAVGAAQTVPNGKVCRGGDIPANTSHNTVDAIDTGVNPTSDIGSQGTISFWYRSASNWGNGASQARDLFDAGTNTSMFLLQLSTNGSLTFAFTDSSGRSKAVPTTQQTFTAGTWVYVTLTWDMAVREYDIYANGSRIGRGRPNSSGSLARLSTLLVGDSRANSAGASGYSANGTFDEIRIYNQALSVADITADMARTHPCNQVAAFVITEDGAGINCMVEPVTLRAVDSLGNTVTDYTGTISLSTSTGHGDWSIGTGNGTLAPGPADSGTAAYTFSTADQGQVTLGLSDVHAETVVLAATDGSASDDGTQSPVTFRPYGFVVTPSPVGTQISAKPFALTFTAAGQTPSQPQCGVIKEYTGAKNIRFWSTYVTPASGTLPVSVNGTAVATSEAASTPQTVTFSQGVATVNVAYPDAGSIQIHAKDDAGIGKPPAGTGDEIIGGVAPFVVRPFAFYLDVAGNPSATSATDPVFKAAGSPFAATLRPVVWQSGDNPSVNADLADNAVTPNFGQISPSPVVALTHQLQAPAGGRLGTLTGGGNLTSFTDGPLGGEKNVTLSWDDVGILELDARTTNFLGGGQDVTGARPNVGRFIPASFSVTPVTQTPACGTFTYAGYNDGSSLDHAGQPFLVTATITALSGDGTTTTQNYTGAFAKLGVGDVAATALSGGNPATGTLIWAPDSLSFTNGVGSLTASNTQWAFSAPSAPQSITLRLVPTDSDGVTGTGDSNAAEFRYGRLNLLPAYGPQTQSLPMTLRAQYFDGSVFVDNPADSCTAMNAGLVSFSNWTDTLNPGDTQVLSIDSPTLLSGDGGLVLKAPGAGTASDPNEGSVTVSVTPPNWLLYDHDGNGTLDPAVGVATFGIYHGNSHVIYRREVY